MDKLEFDAEITDVKWVTLTTGIVNPVLVLDKQYEAIKGDDSQSFDGIMVEDFKDIRTRKYGIGSKVKIKCDEQLQPKVDEVYEESSDFKFDKKCRYCQTDLIRTNDVTYCINHLCPAQGRTTIFKLLTLANMVTFDRQSVVDIHAYLNDFPYKGSVSRVEHMYAYLQMLHHERHNIPTQKRKDVLEAQFGEKGAGIWLYEFTALNKLTTGLKTNELMYVLGLPFSESDAKKFAKHDVFKYGLDGKRIKKLKLSDEGMDVVFQNTRLINLMYPTIAKFSN